MLVRTEAKVLDGLAAILGPTEDQGVAARRGSEGKLIERHGLAAGGDDASAGGGGESQGSDGDLGEGQEAVVVGDGANDDDGALLALLVDVGDDARQGDRRAVHLGHEEPAEDDLVEGRISAACMPPHESALGRYTPSPRSRPAGDSTMEKWGIGNNVCDVRARKR